MRAAKHLALQKFEPVDMPLRDAITLRPRASSTNSGIISTDAIGKAPQFCYLALLRFLEPPIQCLFLAFFEQGHKFLTQEVDGAKFVTCPANLIDLLALERSQFLR